MREALANGEHRSLLISRSEIASEEAGGQPRRRRCARRRGQLRRHRTR
jgi:hypothetical protein